MYHLRTRPCSNHETPGKQSQYIIETIERIQKRKEIEQFRGRMFTYNTVNDSLALLILGQEVDNSSFHSIKIVERDSSRASRVRTKAY